eukprot:gene24750-29907_t
MQQHLDLSAAEQHTSLDVKVLPDAQHSITMVRAAAATEPLTLSRSNKASTQVSRVLPKQLTSLPAQVLPINNRKLPPHTRRSFDIQSLEDNVQSQRARLMSTVTPSSSSRVGATNHVFASELAEFDRVWLLNNSTGLFLDFRSGRSVRRLSARSIAGSKLARHYPDLAESSLVKRYRSQLPGNAGVSWLKVTKQYKKQLRSTQENGHSAPLDIENNNVQSEKEHGPEGSPEPESLVIWSFRGLFSYFRCFIITISLPDGLPNNVDAQLQNIRHQPAQDSVVGEGSSVAGEKSGADMVSNASASRISDCVNTYDAPSGVLLVDQHSALSDSSVDSVLIRDLFSDMQSSSEDYSSFDGDD